MNITRIWHGKTPLEKGEQYLNFLIQDGTKEYRQTPGNISTRIWSSKQDDAHHFCTVTEWKNMESIKEFAGEDYRKAKYYPEDQGVLLEFEDTVQHYTCIDVSSTRIQAVIQKFKWLFNGGSWQGKSWSELLSDISADVAFEKLTPDTNCIAEIVWHCLYWRTVLIHRLTGDHQYKARTVQTDNFRSYESLLEIGWENLVRKLETTQTQLLDLLTTRLDSLLDEDYEPGYTYQYLIEGVIEHDIYHLGQIGLLKSIACKK